VDDVAGTVCPALPLLVLGRWVGGALAAAATAATAPAAAPAAAAAAAAAPAAPATAPAEAFSRVFFACWGAVALGAARLEPTPACLRAGATGWEARGRQGPGCCLHRQRYRRAGCR